MPAFAPGAKLLGSAKLAGSATDIGPVLIPDGYSLLIVTFYIAGYSAGQIAQIRLGTATTVDTGANYSSWSGQIAAAAAAGASHASATGIQVAHTAITNARRGTATIENVSGENKLIVINSADYSAQAPTAASGYAQESQVVGGWFNTAVAKAIGLNSGGAGTLNTGSYIRVHGIPAS